jgi:DNA repair exonuclease SbcCD nuclease subunit
MRILVIADLHLDLWEHTSRDPLWPMASVFPTLDALIIAGDLTNDPMQNWPKALERIARLIDPSEVYIIPGNHDYYGHHLSGDNNLRSVAERAGVNFAQQTAVELGGARFLCCTLWTDFALQGAQDEAMRAAQRAMNDYAQIARSAQDLARIRPQDTLAKHKEHLAWLRAKLQGPFDGPTIIVTHHCPSSSALDASHRLAPAYGSNLDHLMLTGTAKLWLFGHTHRRLRGNAHGTPVVNVSFGYPREVEDEDIAEVMLRGVIDTRIPGLLVKPGNDE